MATSKNKERPVAADLVRGLAAGVAMVSATVAVRLLLGSVTITELAADWLTMTLPPATIDFLLERLSTYAKPSMLVGLLAAQLVAGGAVGVGYGQLSARLPASDREWPRAFAVSGALWVVSMLTLVPLFGGGVFGADARGGTVSFLAASLVTYAVYGVALAALFGEASRAGDAIDHGRRAVLRKTVVWASVVAAVALGGKFLLDRARSQVSNSASFRVAGVLSTEVTPNEEFYVISKNFIDPVIDSERWGLEITGLVERPRTLTYEELVGLPSVERFVTLECISNEVGGDLISTALWRGVPLRDVLESAGLKPGILDVAIESEDGYSESIPVERAMRDEVLVAYEMNGESLPESHGFPARLIIPGFFGLKSVKWLKKIEPVPIDYVGYWQQRGWTDDPVVKTMSRIDTPATKTAQPRGPLQIAGVAFAGDRGIAKVELSLDAGTTWTEVDETTAPLSAYTWIIWKARALPGSFRLAEVRVRATDGDGAVQTHRRMATIPDGATGHHEILVELV